jgi:redox-sensing transcriptional repressor
MAVFEVPDIVIGRLPIYLRALNHLMIAGQEFTSSQELGNILGIT